MNLSEPDEALRIAVHDAVAPVSASFDLVDRIRTAASRRRRRLRTTGALGIAAVTASAVAFVAHGGSRSDDSAVKVAAPTCPAEFSAFPLEQLLRAGTDKQVVPGSPVVATVCTFHPNDSRPKSLPSNGLHLSEQHTLRGDRLEGVVAALNKAHGGGEVLPMIFADELWIDLRYTSGPDVVVTVKLATLTSDVSNGKLFVHFSPDPIPDAIASFGTVVPFPWPAVTPAKTAQ